MRPGCLKTGSPARQYSCQHYECDKYNGNDGDDAYYFKISGQFCDAGLKMGLA